MRWTKRTTVGLAAVLWMGYRRYKRLDLEDKCVLISGGSRGLGLEMAREFLKGGSRVALLARDADELERARAALTRSSVLDGIARADVTVVAGDVRDPDSVRRAVDEVIADFGRIDILANVAGIIDVAPYEHLTEEDFRDSLDTHLWGPLHLIRNVTERMNPGSRIINISSIGGLVSVPHLLPYSVGKFALTGYSEGLRTELARRGIFVTTVCPGLMRTGSHVRARFKGRHQQEFAWFSASSGLPLASTSARKAARKIVAACRMGKPFLILTPQARALHLVHALAPNTTAHMMALAARLLPDSTGAEGDTTLEGWQSTSRAAPSVLTLSADRAIDRNNELPDRAEKAYFGIDRGFS